MQAEQEELIFESNQLNGTIFNVRNEHSTFECLIDEPTDVTGHLTSTKKVTISAESQTHELNTMGMIFMNAVPCFF